ncbi:MAG TPA: hypothetical protein VIJ52_08190 [Pseudolabrys sp.]
MPRHSIYVSTEIEISEVFDQMDNAHLHEECGRRGMKFVMEVPTLTDTRFNEAVCQMEYEFDTLLHEIREAFLSRDHRHFEVSLSRCEGRYRATLVTAMAQERVKEG